MDKQLRLALEDKIASTKNSSINLLEGPIKLLGYKEYTYKTIQKGIEISYLILKWESSKRTFFNCAIHDINHLQTWSTFKEAKYRVERLLEAIYYIEN